MSVSRELHQIVSMGRESVLICGRSINLKYSDPLLPLGVAHCREGELITKSLKVDRCWNCLPNVFSLISKNSRICIYFVDKCACTETEAILKRTTR